MAQIIVVIGSQMDAVVARPDIRRFVAERGASPVAAAEIEVVVRELASNLWRHAGAGQIRLSTIAGSDLEILIEADDNGPGLPDDAFQDGYSTQTGLGSGLGAVRRMTDRLEIRSGSSGTHIRAWKRLLST